MKQTYKELREIQKQIPESKIIKVIGAFGLWEYRLIKNGMLLNIKKKEGV